MVTKQIRGQRARSPQDKVLRRNSLLDAARALLTTRRFEAISVAEMAETAGLAKGTMYLYFASKEELFLALLQRELTLWKDSVTARLTALPDRASPAQIAGAIASSVSDQPVLAQLVTILPGVLEQNLTDETALAFKRFLATTVNDVGTAIEQADDQLPTESGDRIVMFLSAVVAGLWPMSHPAPPVDRALADEDVSHLRVEFERDLNEMLFAVLSGMRADNRSNDGNNDQRTAAPRRRVNPPVGN